MKKQRMQILLSFLLLALLAGYLLSSVSAHAADARGTGRPGGSTIAVDEGGTTGGWFSISGITTKAVGKIFEWVGYLIAAIGGLLLIMAGWSIDFALEVNSQVVFLPAVQVGWVVVRDITNLFFVLGIVVIAFATILRNQSYGVRQTLWKLIIMAVLINFSLAIASVFLDSAGILTQFFIDKSTPSLGGVSSFATSLANAFQPQRLWQIKNAGLTVGGLASGTAGIGQAISGVYFIILFTYTAVVAFFSLAAMLMTRFVHIAILLIFAPIAWFFWIFPGIGSQVGGKNLFSWWWSEFIRWTFFPVIVSFLLYLAILTVSGSGTFVQDAAKATPTASADAFAKGSQGTFASDSAGWAATQAQMYIFLALMGGGMVAANKLSITGSEKALQVANWGAKMMQNGATSLGKYGARRGSSWVANRGYKDNAETGERQNWVQRSANWAASKNLYGVNVGRVFQPLSKKVDQAIKWTRPVEDAQKEAEKRSGSVLLNRVKNPTFQAKEQTAGHFLAALDKGLNLDDLDPKALKKNWAALRDTGMLAKIVDKEYKLDQFKMDEDPDRWKDLRSAAKASGGATIKKFNQKNPLNAIPQGVETDASLRAATIKAVKDAKPADVVEWSEETFNNIHVVSNMSVPQIVKLANEGSDDKFKKAIKKLTDTAEGKITDVADSAKTGLMEEAKRKLRSIGSDPIARGRAKGMSFDLPKTEEEEKKERREKEEKESGSFG